MQHDSDYFLEFDIETSRYLGTSAVATICLESLRRLPKELKPTKVEDSAFCKSTFSFARPNAFLEAVPGSAPFDGRAQLYKAKGIFAFHLSWSKGSKQWYLEHPGQKFNGAGMSIRDGYSVIRQEQTFSKLQEVWLDLLVRLDAAYGYAYLRDVKQRSHSPRGHGRCLPRLHWQTYFGPAYEAAFGLSAKSTSPHFELRHVKERGSLAILKADPRELCQLSVVERAAIAELGPTYFWGHTVDDWRNPTAHYDVPAFDWSEVIVE